MRKLRLNIWLALLAVTAGVCFGIGSYTFYYAQGASYLSNNPEVCVNCHIMREYFDSWQKSGHHAVAVCNDCHLPHNVVGKYYTKAENGFLHSKAFTLQNFHEPIQIRQSSGNIVRDNCIRCHGEFISQTGISAHGDESLNCAHCHQNIAHGP